MGDKITLQNLASLQNQTSAINTINNNFDIIEAKIDTLLSRDGDTPNEMESNLDMNSYRITNLPAPLNDTEPARLRELRRVVEDGIPTIPDWSKVIQAANYDTLEEAITAFNALGEGAHLLLQGGAVYTHNGPINPTAFQYTVSTDNGQPAWIDFSGSTGWSLNGLWRIEGSLQASTESTITKSLSYSAPVLTSSGTVFSGDTVEIVTLEAHGFTTGDEIFVQYWGDANTNDVKYLTMKDSNEAMSLDIPVAVTVVDPTTIRYTAPGGAPSGPLSVTVAVFRNTQVITVADSALFAVGDIVQIESTATETGYGGTTITRAELNKVAWIIDSTRIWLDRGVRKDYLTTDTAKVTKVNTKKPVIKNIKIKGKGYHTTPGTTADVGFYCLYTENALYENLFVENANYMSFRHVYEYKPQYINCGFQHQRNDSGGKTTGNINGNLQYGFASCNSVMDPLYLDCYGSGGRHNWIESCTNSFKGIVYNASVIRFKSTDCWSYNLSTHEFYDKVQFIDCEVYNGGGLNIRNGNALIDNLTAHRCTYGVHAYGHCDNIVIRTVRTSGSERYGVLIAPSGVGIPHINNLDISDVTVLRSGSTGVGVILPNNINAYGVNIRDIRGDNIYGNGVGLQNGSSSAFYSPRITGVDITNVAFTPVSVGTAFYAFVSDISARRTGTFNTVSFGGISEQNHAYRINGVSTDGGTVTQVSVPSASTGNMTDSLLFENKTIASGVIVKNFRNVPLLKVDTQSGAATDDLDTITGLLRGDRVIISPWDATHDVVLTQSGNLRTGWNRTLTTSSDTIELLCDGSNLRTLDFGQELQGSTTYDPASLADGAGVTTTVTVTGAALGDFVVGVSFSLNLQGITVTAYVSAANTVSVRFQNESGGVLDLGSGTLTARVRRSN